MMATANMTAKLNASLDAVWRTVTSLDDFSWRSDLSKIEILQENKKFIEYSKEGYKTEFFITVFLDLKQYEFDMENENMKGHWVGRFFEEEGGTKIDFTETVDAKKWFIKPFVSSYLKKQQKQYLTDLKNSVEK